MSATHKPPPIGEALGAGWAAYKANFGAVLLSTFVAMLMGSIPVIGHFIAIPGMYLVALKAVRGQKPTINDSVIGFQKIADHIVIGLLQACGILLCIVGVYATQPLFAPGTFYILDGKMDWKAAKDKCMADVKPNLVSWMIFHFVIMFSMAMLGLLLCFFGIYFTMPIATCAMAYAYEKTLKGEEAGALAQNTGN